MPRLIRIEPGFVFIDDERLQAHFTVTELKLLRAIVGRRYVVTKEALLTDLYAGRDEPESKIIDVFVCKLRRKLGPHAGAVMTAWGRGYTCGPDYELIASRIDGGATIQISNRLSGQLDEAAFEANMAAADLAEVLLTQAVSAFRREAWAA